MLSHDRVRSVAQILPSSAEIAINTGHSIRYYTRTKYNNRAVINTNGFDIFSKRPAYTYIMQIPFGGVLGHEAIICTRQLR